MANDGEPRSENTTEPSQLPAVEIPDAFVERYFWSHNSDASAIPPVYPLCEEVVEEIQAAAANTFGRVEKKEEDATVHSITLFCPHQGGHLFVDSMVNLIACRQNADVLVLDALEVASVQFGAIGKAVGNIISSLDDTEPSDDDKTQRYIDALVNISSKKNSTGKEHDSAPATRRILYIRDYGGIAPAGEFLLGFILRAIKKNNESSPSTILVLGAASGIELISGEDDANEDCRTKWHDALRAGGKTLEKILPEFSFRYPHDPQSQFCPLSSQFFLPKAYPSPGERKRCRRRELDESLSRDFVFTVIPQNAHSKESRTLRQIAIKERTRDINEALLRLCLGRMGGLIDGNLSDKVFEGNDRSRDRIQSSVLSRCAAEAIAATAIGLVNPEPQGPIPASQIVKAHEIYLKSLQVRKDWMNEEKPKSTARNKHCMPSHNDNIIDRVMKSQDLSKHEKALLGCIVKPEMLTITFDNVCAEPTVVDTLRSMISLPLLFPEQFGHGVLARQGLGGVLLYGPPGTGKTTLCRALAYECGAQMLIIKPSDIFNKWAGESEKLASALFSLARRLSPCVIFIDEADTLFGQRSNSWRDDILTEFLQEMDGFSSASTNTEKRVVIIGATNRPFDLDPAVLRRLPRRMMVGLPAKGERKDILKIHLKGETLHDDVNLDELADITNEYSGSDLKDLCVSAAMAAMKEAIGEPNWKSLRKYKHLDSDSEADESETSIGAEEASKGDESQAADDPQATPETRPIRVVTKAHFSHALEKILPSFSERAQAQMYKWHKANSSGARNGTLP